MCSAIYGACFFGDWSTVFYLTFITLLAGASCGALVGLIVSVFDKKIT